MVDFFVNSEWFTGSTKIITYHLEELMATKLKALYQRRKGRDLFDLWLVLNQNLINISEVISIFEKYCKHNDVTITRALLEQSLAQKRQHQDFILDMKPLLAPDMNWDFEEAFMTVQQKLVNCLPGESWKG